MFEPNFHVKAWRNGPWWWYSLAEWEARPHTVPAFGARERQGRIDAAADFIHRFHAPATAHGWQPAHLLGERGLAKRWSFAGTAPPRLAWAQRQMLFRVNSWIGLQAERDGSVRLLTGAELTALMGRCVNAVSMAA